jgi:hypothetical protein
MCIGDRINNPPESFHYSYLYTHASRSVDQQADVTAKAMDTTIKDKSGSHSYHGARSDEASGDRAVLDLSGRSCGKSCQKVLCKWAPKTLIASIEQDRAICG